MTLTQDSFDALLEWLDPDRDKAGQSYEAIRCGLIRIFVSKGLIDAEFYADETVDRVVKRLPEIRDGYVNEPARYFIGVARNVIREALRRKEVNTDVLPEFVTFRTGESDMSDCLGKCLKALPREKFELIHDYHAYEGKQKIASHREMAGERAISVGALRTRAHHVRNSLETCVNRCLDERRNKSVGDRHNNRAASRRVHHS